MAYPVLQFVIFYLFVNFNSILLSFKNIDIYDYTKFSWTLDNFTRWFKDPTMFEQMITAAGVSIKVYLISLVVGVPLGLFFSYYIFKKLPASGSIARIAASSLAIYTRSPCSAVTMERSFRRSFSAINPPEKPRMMENGPVMSSEENTVRK